MTDRNEMANSEWKKLLSDFRRLGGVAENICQREGHNGRGIFPVDLKAESKIFTPKDLLVPVKDIVLDENLLKINPNASYDQETRDFFESYQEQFSWGRGGKDSVEVFEKGLKALPAKVKETIKTFKLADCNKRHAKSWDKAILERFLSARQFKFRNTPVIAPLLELVNHEVISNPFQVSANGISTPQTVRIGEELTHRYGNCSPLHRVFRYGFTCKETIVFSFPFDLDLASLDTRITCQGIMLQDDSMKFVRNQNNIIVEGLPVSDLTCNGLPPRYFKELIKRAGLGSDKADLLKKIIQFNREAREQLLKQLVNIDSAASRLIKEALVIELNIMSSSPAEVGRNELGY